MLVWLHKRGKDVIGFREIIQCGRSPRRMKKAADAALAAPIFFATALIRERV
jgi:hypothetical protein